MPRKLSDSFISPAVHPQGVRHKRNVNRIQFNSIIVPQLTDQLEM